MTGCTRDHPEWWTTYAQEQALRESQEGYAEAEERDERRRHVAEAYDTMHHQSRAQRAACICAYLVAYYATWSDLLAQQRRTLADGLHQLNEEVRRVLDLHAQRERRGRPRHERLDHTH